MLVVNYFSVTVVNYYSIIHIYVDGNLVSREDDIVRDENVRSIGANVSDGSVLMLKVIATSNVSYNTCFITDTELTQIQ